jgi:hypothetical protein
MMDGEVFRSRQCIRDEYPGIQGVTRWLAQLTEEIWWNSGIFVTPGSGLFLGLELDPKVDTNETSKGCD